MELIIVESPTKAGTISRFLKGDFLVRSSYGHIRDLPKSKLGVDVEHDFEPEYQIPAKAKKVIEALTKEVKKTKTVILATDEDREGEAIAWHLLHALALAPPKTKKPKKGSLAIKRIVFHEITKEAIEEALKNPRSIDMHLVDSQQARRVLDRLVGYQLSPFLWKKIRYGLSAGRVQSATLRLIVEREREIEAFVPQEYWEINALLKTKKNEEFSAHLVAIDGRALDPLAIKTKGEAERISDGLQKSACTVSQVTKREVKRRPLAPFTTSTLQQEAFRRLRFSSKQTMVLAQQLYEQGFITYMRTDSVNLSHQSIAMAQNYLHKELGSAYALHYPRHFKTKSRLAQEAHEVIRPTDTWKTPEHLKTSFEPRAIKLYDLIWRRFLASQMPEAVFDATTVEVTAGKYLLRANGQVIKFDGFLKIWKSEISETLLPEVQEGEAVTLAAVLPSQHFTQPPPRYTDASLVKILEEYGIGRPSTYAPIIATIQERGYVERDERRSFHPTSIGVIVNDLLVKHFPEIVDYGFTAKMEEELDEIAEGKRQWVPVIREFYEPFQQNLKIKYEAVSRREATERPSEEICDKCGRSMVIKNGRYGDFLACSGYPECSNIKKLPKQTLGIPCPKCGKSGGGEVVMRRVKKNRRIFYGCSRWPKCDFASWKKPKIGGEEEE